MACILLGIFNLILARSDWEEYFESRLKSIVVDQSYLGGLEPGALKRLMLNVIKAQAPGAAVDRAGGFLEYFETYLHKFIFDPFRENATAEFYYDDDPGDEEALRVTDKYTYSLRSVGGRIQNSISFTIEGQECKSAESVSLSIKLPMGSAEPGKVISFENQFAKTSEGDYQVDQPIPPEYITMDGLEVTVESRYRVRKDRFQMWWMLYPTRDIRVIINFPKSYEIQIKAFVQAPELCDWTRRPGYVQLRYPSWFLPSNGVAWKFVSPASDPTESGPDPQPVPRAVEPKALPSART